MALFIFQAKEDYEREQSRKERRKETGESKWMLPSLSERLTEEADSEEKVNRSRTIASIIKGWSIVNNTVVCILLNT